MSPSLLKSLLCALITPGAAAFTHASRGGRSGGNGQQHAPQACWPARKINTSPPSPPFPLLYLLFCPPQAWRARNLSMLQFFGGASLC